MSKQRVVCQACLLSLSLYTVGMCQGLFENADAGADGQPSFSYQLNGYVKAGAYAGRAENDDAEMKAGKGQVSLRLEAEKAGFGKAFERGWSFDPPGHVQNPFPT